MVRGHGAGARRADVGLYMAVRDLVHKKYQRGNGLPVRIMPDDYSRHPCAG
jgi:hypothetical protein